MTPQEQAPTTPVATAVSKDLLYERRLSNNGSEDGTAATDEVSTPNNSDPHVLYDNDSPSFVLPEIEEDYPDEDDETNISTVSRISAAFVQFSPSIAASASADQESAENDLAHMGLSTVDAPNKPNFVQCVTSVNFLAEQESTQQHHHHNQHNDNSPPMPIQVTVNSKLVSKRKKKISKKQQVKIVDTPEQLLPQEQLAGCPRGGGVEDAEEIFSVRSDPLIRRRVSNLGRHSMRRPSPNHHQQSLLTKTASVSGPRTSPPPPPSDNNESSSSPPPLQTPKRAISMPANHIAPQNITMNMNNYNSAMDSQNSDGDSVISDASRSSRASSVASGTSSASAPTMSYERRSLPSQGRTGSRQFVPNHLQQQPTARRTASFQSSSSQQQLHQRQAAPSIPDENGNKKEKKGMFSKLFANQVQADFDDVQLMILQAEGAKGARIQTSANLTYGVDTSSGRGSIGSGHDPALDPGDMAQDYSASGAGSVCSFSNASVRSYISRQSASGGNASVTGDQQQQQQQPPPRRRIMSNHVQPDFGFDLSHSMSRQSSQASMSESLNSDLADRSQHSTTLSETHPGSANVGGGDTTGKKGIGKFFKRKTKECDVPA